MSVFFVLRKVKKMSVDYKKRGSNWSSNETRAIIDICKELNIAKLMDSKAMRHTDIYKKIQYKLESQDIFKTIDQIKSKYKNMKHRFYKETKEFSKSGAGGTKSEFYEDLYDMFHTRPIAECSMYGFDTSELQPEDEGN